MDHHIAITETTRNTEIELSEVEPMFSNGSYSRREFLPKMASVRVTNRSTRKMPIIQVRVGGPVILKSTGKPSEHTDDQCWWSDMDKFESEAPAWLVNLVKPLIDTSQS